MSRLSLLVLLVLAGGCASRTGWGFPWGQGTVDRQKSRAAAYDPYPLNDIGPEVLGGRPRDFMTPLPEAKRAQIGPTGNQYIPQAQFPPTFQFPPQQPY